jgi:hypothetical protein
MRPADNLSKSFKKLHVRTSTELDESIYKEIFRAAGKTEARKASQAVVSIFSAIIKARIIKIAAAAMVIAGIIGLDQFISSIRGTSVVWADVAERFKKVRSYKSKGRRVLSEVGQEEPFFQCDILRYFSPEHGSVEESYEDGELAMLAYCSIAEESALAVLSDIKMCLRFDLNEELLSLVEYVNPANTDGIMKAFGSERCVKLGARVIDGVSTEGFEVKDVKLLSHVPRFLLHVEDINIRMWINEETSLPMRVEGEGFFKGFMTGFKNCRYEEVMQSIEYDVEIDEGIFEPNIPNDYTLVDPAKIAERAELVLVGILPLSALIIIYKRFRRKGGKESKSAGTRISAK